MEYKLAAGEASAEFTEKHSRFIGTVRPVFCEEEAAAFLARLRSQYWDATHNVYAYVLREGQTKRYSDDGEPQGTAGIPVLDVLLKSGVTNTAVVVTRYFGGVLLGAGGLVRAYSHSASLALQKVGIVTMQLCVAAKICCDYSQYGRLAAMVPEHRGVIEDTLFLENVTLLFHIPGNLLSSLETDVADATCGQCFVEKTGEGFFAQKTETA